MRYINELSEGENIIEHYLCKKKNTLKSRAGKSYLSLVLQDKTGTVDAKVWELNNNIQSFDENDFIKIDASVLTYQNELQLNVKKIRRSHEGEYDPMDYIPSTDKDVNELYKKLLEIVKSIEDPYLRQLGENVFINNKEISEKFKQHSAAKAMHHNYMGGLLEHTLNVAEICDFMAPRYKHVNRDLTVLAGLLHDIGKIKELSDFPINDYTDEGQLIGHIVIGAELITEEAAKIENFPQELKNLLKHCILAHHGEYEFGSPKRPKTMEAFILHAADDTDAKLKMFQDAIDSDNTAGNWAGYQKMLSRNIRNSKYSK